ncbi:MAG: hypothetical protein JWP31_1058 [Aeromicrobium sp.]|nr:hypothetical protein [Aeromicrobium sp.]
MAGLRRPIALLAVLVLVAAAIVAAVAAVGGGSDDDPGASPSATSSASTPPAIDAGQKACSLLTSGERTRLAGSAVDDIVAAAGRSGSSQCRWQSDDALVQVTTLPAEQWAKQLPDVVAQLESSGTLTSADDKDDLARAKKLLDGIDSFTGDQACAAFETLSEIDGSPPGTNTTVTALPITETEAGLSGQTCSAGTLTSIIYSVPGLSVTPKSEAALKTALKAAQKRAVTADQ